MLLEKAKPCQGLLAERREGLTVFIYALYCMLGLQRRDPKQRLLGIKRPQSVESIMVRHLDGSIPLQPFHLVSVLHHKPRT